MKKWLPFSAVMLVLIFIMANARDVQGVEEIATRTPKPPPPKAVSIKMADGLEIKGDFYTPTSSETGPAALLMHQMAGSSYDWKGFANLLVQKGYSVLAVDLRGQGITKGDTNWQLAQKDTVELMGWLRNQSNIDPKRVAVMGASIGSNLALRGCADDDMCHVAIALSPGTSYFGVSAKDAISAMKNKAILLIASQEDVQSGDSTKYLTSLAARSVNILTRVYASAVMHGMGLFTFKDTTPLIMQWLDEYNTGK